MDHLNNAKGRKRFDVPDEIICALLTHMADSSDLPGSFLSSTIHFSEEENYCIKLEEMIDEKKLLQWIDHFCFK